MLFGEGHGENPCRDSDLHESSPLASVVQSCLQDQAGFGGRHLPGGQWTIL